MGEAVTQDRPSTASTGGVSTTGSSGAGAGTQEKAAAGGGGGQTAVHPDDAALQAAQDAKDAFFKDAYQKTGPLDGEKAPGSDINDPDGHCRHCGANIGMGVSVCDDCGYNAQDHNKELDDFWYEHRNQSNSEIQQAWNNSPEHQEKLKTKNATKSQTNF